MAAIKNDRVFIVDNAMEQDENINGNCLPPWSGPRRLGCASDFRKPDILKLAAESGCWFVYQAIWQESQMIRDKVRMMHDFGIAVEGTILLGMTTTDRTYLSGCRFSSGL